MRNTIFQPRQTLITAEWLNAVDATLFDNNLSSVTPLSFGGAGDGVVDDYSALQKAIDSVGTTRVAISGNTCPIQTIDLGGRTWATSQQLIVSKSGVKITNGRIIALPGSWGTNSAILSFIGGTAASSLVWCFAENLILDGKKRTSCLLFEGVGSSYAKNCYTQYYTEFGIRAWKGISGTKKSPINIESCYAQEYAFSDTTNNTYANRTGIGFDIQSADGYLVNCIGSISKYTLKISNLYNYQVTNCHFWQGTYDTGRHTPNVYIDSTAHNVIFTGCYFDNAVVQFYSFAHNINGCYFTNGDNGKNTYGLELIPTSSGETLTGFNYVGNTVASGLNHIEYITTSGTFAEVTNATILGNNGGTVPPNIVQPRTRNTKSFVAVNNKVGQYSYHNVSGDTGVVVTNWSTNDTYYPHITFGKSVSGAVGTYGGYPTAGTWLGMVSATGDSGTSFSTLDRTGAFISFKATSTWTSTNNETEINLGLTPNGSFNTNATIYYTFDTTAAKPNIDNAVSLGKAASRWSVVYAATGTINTSDERTKTEISSISDSILDAWEKVEWVSFKFTDSVEKKGTTARIHFGLIAQKVKQVFEEAGLDAFSLGLLCYDEWEDQYDENGSVTLPAGNRYGIRYEEALSLEAACLRRQLKKLQ